MSLRGGVSTGDITPDGPVSLLGYPDQERVSTGVHDSLQVNVLHLRGPSAAVIVAGLDLFCLSAETARAVRRAVSEKSGIPEDFVFVGCTHTHSAPATIRAFSWSGQPGCPDPDPAYLERMAERVAASAAHAAATTRPVEAAWTSASVERFTSNRFSIDGAVDPEVGLLCVRNAGADLTAVVAVCNPHPSAVRSTATEITSDYHGFLRTHLRELLGPDVTVVTLAGSCADQGWMGGPGEGNFTCAEWLGRSIAEEAAAQILALSSRSFSSDVVLAAARRSAEVQSAQLPSVWDAKLRWGDLLEAVDRARSGGKTPVEIRMLEQLTQGARATMTLVEAQRRGILSGVLAALSPAEAHGVRIGDGFLAGLPGEPSAAIGLAVKRGMGGRRAWPVGFVGGDLQGYLMGPEAGKGHYGARGVLVSPQSATALVEACVAACTGLA